MRGPFHRYAVPTTRLYGFVLVFVLYHLGPKQEDEEGDESE